MIARPILYTLQQVQEMFPDEKITLNVLVDGAKILYKDQYLKTSVRRHKFFVKLQDTRFEEEADVKKILQFNGFAVIEWLDRKHPEFSYYDAFVCSSSDIDLKQVIRMSKLRLFV
jgi:hypothetical protein